MLYHYYKFSENGEISWDCVFNLVLGGTTHFRNRRTQDAIQTSKKLQQVMYLMPNLQEGPNS